MMDESDPLLVAGCTIVGAMLVLGILLGALLVGALSGWDLVGVTWR